MESTGTPGQIDNGKKGSERMKCLYCEEYMTEVDIGVWECHNMYCMNYLQEKIGDEQ